MCQAMKTSSKFVKYNSNCNNYNYKSLINLKDLFPKYCRFNDAFGVYLEVSLYIIYTSAYTNITAIH